uniref:Uncharacterized protein n=1 Tax=Arundo donax TaxID=35708 RepID=A0A0A9CIT0_ARUDO
MLILINLLTTEKGVYMCFHCFIFASSIFWSVKQHYCGR